MKKILALLLAAIMVLALVACSGSNTPSTTAGSDTKGSDSNESVATEPASNLDPVTLKIWFHGSNVNTETDEYKQIIDAINEYLGEKINVTLSPIWGTWGDFDTAVTTALAGGDDCDIYFTCNWSANDYNVYSRNGYYARLDEDGNNLLEQYAPELLTTIPEGIWDAAKTNGADGFGVYAVPALKDTATQNTWDVNVTLLTELGYNIDDLRANGIDYYSDEFEEMLAKAKEAKGADFYPLVFEPLVLERTVNLSSIVTGDQNSLLSYYFDAEDPSKDIGSTIVNKYGTEKFQKYAERTYELAQKGYISPSTMNVGTSNDYLQNCRAEGAYLFGTQSYAYGYEHEVSASRGITVEFIPAHAPYMDCTSGQGAMMAVSSASKNKERAVMFLNLLNTDSKLMTMMNYGLEGVTYTTNADGTITFIKEARDLYSPWRNGMGNVRLLPPTEAEGVTYWDDFANYYNSAKLLPYGAFIFDSTEVETEVAALTNVYSQYAFNLMSGAVDPATELPVFLKALDDAGMQDVVNAANAQLTEYMANN